MKTSIKQHESIYLLLSDVRGTNIPKDAVSFLQDDNWQGFDKSLLDDLSDPYNEYYWDTWDVILNNAFYMSNGNKFTLWQDGDLFAYCYELMSDEEKENFSFDA